MTVKIDGTNTVANPAFTGADTDTGLQCGTNEVKLVTGGTGRATVDSSGRLLVGTSSGSSEPIAAFQGRATDANDGGMIAISRAGASPSGSIGELRFSTGDDLGKYYGMIVGASNGTTSSTSLPGMLRFSTTASGSTSPTERMRITADGTLKLSNSPGIDFSDLQTNVSGMTSELLDSYEEGTWTPVIRVEGQGSNTATDEDYGHYVKIGKVVHCWGQNRLNGTPSGRSTSAAIELRGFPFAHRSGYDKISHDVRVHGWETGSTYGSDITFIMRMLVNQTYARIEALQAGYNGTRNASLTMQDNTLYGYSFTYEVA